MRLFHYVPEKRASILAEGLICFSSADQLNDPFEMSPTLAGFSSFDDIQKHEDQWTSDIFACVVRELSEKAQLPVMGDKEIFQLALEGSLDTDIVRRALERAREVKTKILHDELRDYGVLCLTNDRKNLAMWAYYANSHCGFVIEFDTSHDFFTQSAEGLSYQFNGVHPVTYVDERPAVFSSAPLEQKLVAQFLSKGREWEKEREWRCFRYLSDANKITSKNAHLFKLPLSCIKSVTLGARMNKRAQNKLIKLFRELDFSTDFVCEKAYINPERYDLDFLPIEI